MAGIYAHYDLCGLVLIPCRPFFSIFPCSLRLSNFPPKPSKSQAFKSQLPNHEQEATLQGGERRSQSLHLLHYWCIQKSTSLGWSAEPRWPASIMTPHPNHGPRKQQHGQSHEASFALATQEVATATCTTSSAQSGAEAVCQLIQVEVGRAKQGLPEAVVGDSFTSKVRH
eukprot:6183915-Amphidinium_carterae.2